MGTDAQPRFRVFNPVTQGKRFDPDGQDVRRCVRIGVAYPAPIANHATARLHALAGFRAYTSGRPPD